MALGDAFPVEYLRAQILRRLIPGVVIKLREVMDDGQIHEKRYVVLRVDATSTCCVVNSRIGPFIQARPELLQCQVAMPVVDHDFMDHDSHVDCSRTKVFATDRVVRELLGKSDWILGEVSGDLRNQIIGALKYSPTLSPIEVSNLCASLGA